MTGADLRHIDTWLFDLDNTLYPTDSGVGALMDPHMTAYVMKVTGLEHDGAYRLQKDYLLRYGATSRGMHLHHGIDPLMFNAAFHDLPLEGLTPDEALSQALQALPGRRLIFTNADGVHTERVLQRLGLMDLFEAVFHIGSGSLAPKPAPKAFTEIVVAHGLNPATTIFFEDAERNLAPAADLGMTTVLVGPHAAASTAHFVHHRTERLAPFLATARVKEPA